MEIDLQTIWFALIGVLLTGYAVLDGFDLGVGILHLFTRTDHERRIMLNAIGPIWDGNEVWLVTGVGALFAAFREVYATVFSGFYLAFIFFLFALIFRAVAIEFRSKLPMRWWRQMWDILFSLGSLSISLLVGVMMGNIGLGMYPNMVYSQPHPENSLTIYTGSSSIKTLKIMLIIAITGVPLVLAYTASIYWIFRGKVKLDAISY